MPAMAILNQLIDPDNYRALEYELFADGATFDHWQQLFRGQIQSVVEHAIENRPDDPQAQADGQAATAQFLAYLDDLRDQPEKYQHHDLMTVDGERDRALHEHGFPDSHKAVKHRENQLALQVLPGVLAEIDALSGVDRWRAIIQGVFAGNIFDLGVARSIELFRTNGADFHGARDRVRNRHWLVSDFDAFAVRIARGPYRKAALLVDNAGADVVLGMVPLARQLLTMGTQVILAANEQPSLNDIIQDELVELMQTIAGMDATIAEALDTGQLTLISTGNSLPLIDLTRLSDAFVSATADIDLLVLEGMGRAIETNYTARFTCDTLKLAMIKDSAVAAKLRGEVFDVVMRYEPGT